MAYGSRDFVKLTHPTRRTVLTGALVCALNGCTSGRESDTIGTKDMTTNYRERLRGIERSAGGRLGAYVLDTSNGRSFGWRENERFAHASSFKLSLAAMVLALDERGTIDLGEILHWTESDMMWVSPVTRANIATGLSMRELAWATLVTSDNTAANVLLRRLGGPETLTAFWRSTGDEISRLDMYEPELNVVPPGTTLNSTTPMAMGNTLARLMTGKVLSVENTATLSDWMAQVRTGMDRIRAGFPDDWVAGDKTGTGIGDDVHTYVDIAFGAPEGRLPLIVTAYFEPANLVEPMDPVSVRALSDVGRLAFRSISSRGTGM
ncbi:class A beta-lactamase [Qipengyuania sp. MTN3-11]